MEKFFKDQTTLKAITLIGQNLNDTNSLCLINNLNGIKKISIRCSPVTDCFLQQLSEKAESIDEVKLTRTRATYPFNSIKSIYPNVKKITIRENKNC